MYAHVLRAGVSLGNSKVLKSLRIFTPKGVEILLLLTLAGYSFYKKRVVYVVTWPDFWHHPTWSPQKVIGQELHSSPPCTSLIPPNTSTWCDHTFALSEPPVLCAPLE